MLVVVIINQNVFTVMHVFFTVTNIPFRHEFFLYIIFVIIQHKLCNLKWRCSSASITQFSYLPTANYRFGIFQTFITSGHCVVDLPTAYYSFVIVETFITSGHLCCWFYPNMLVVIHPLLITPLISFKHLLLVDIVLSIYPLLITPLVSFKHLLLVDIVLSTFIPLLSLKHLLLVAICVADLPTVNYHVSSNIYTSGHCVPCLPLHKHLLLVDIVLSA